MSGVRSVAHGESATTGLARDFLGLVNLTPLRQAPSSESEVKLVVVKPGHFRMNVFIGELDRQVLVVLTNNHLSFYTQFEFRSF